jgi:Fe-S-cluster containining protein
MDLTEIDTLHAEVDRDVKQLADSSGFKISCRAGCAYCCYYNLTTSVCEMIFAFEGAAKNGFVFDEQLLYSNYNRLDPQLTNRQYAQQQNRCPLLTPDNLCAGYQDRPLICRTFHVANGPDVCIRLENTKVFRSATLPFLLMSKETTLAAHYQLPSPTVAPLSIAALAAYRYIQLGREAAIEFMLAEGMGQPQQFVVKWAKQEIRG